MAFEFICKVKQLLRASFKMVLSRVGISVTSKAGSGPALHTPCEQSRFPYGILVQSCPEFTCLGKCFMESLRAKFIPDASLQSKKMTLLDAKPGCVPGLLFQVSVWILWRSRSEKEKLLVTASVLIPVKCGRGFVDTLFKSMICFLLLVKEGSGSL